MDLEIREPRLVDAEAVARLHYETWREAYAGLLSPAFWSEAEEQRRIDRWTRQLQAPAPAGTTTRIALRRGRPLGLAITGSPQPNDSAGAPVRDRELFAIYVLAAEYGTGLAAQLLDAVLPEDEPAQLWVFEANPRARRFYEKHGFRADGARHLFGPELGDQPEIRMVR